MDVTFGLDANQHHLTWDEVRDRVLTAERLGFRNAWLFDHFKPLYRESIGPCFESWTLLAGLATITSTIRLGTLVTGMTYRHPSMLAMEAITVDHLSGGRLELAVGASWYQPEHDELGFEFPSVGVRAKRLEEGIRVMDLLQTTDGASFDGHYYTLKEATYRPNPVQRPRIPLWIGASGEQLMLPIVGRHADVWHTFAKDLGTLSRKHAVVREAAAAAGRDPGAIRISTSLSLEGSMNEIRERIDTFAEAGVSHFTVGWPSQGREKVDAFSRELKLA